VESWGFPRAYSLSDIEQMKRIEQQARDAFGLP
jgi:hypothetical protein